MAGLDAQCITVEVDLASGLPGLTIVGLPDTAVVEARERVKSAIRHSGFSFPLKRVVVNLAPADVRKAGSTFDLPLAIGILLVTQTCTAPIWLEQTLWLGELSLEGSLRPATGLLSVALMAKAAGFTRLVVPEANVGEASLVEGIEVLGLPHLRDLPVLLLHPASFLKPAVSRATLMAAANQPPKMAIDFADIKGQLQAKRALELAAAGGHNVLMVGPPGSGKSMLAKALPGILPPLTFEEMLAVSRIYSVVGQLAAECPPGLPLMVHRPFRAPHHTASMAGLTGGGPHPRPGEISLAHRGTLFLDELVEFPRPVIEILRQPLEDGVITVSRAQQACTFPAQCMLLAAMNPCPCGYRGDPSRQCTCSEVTLQRYVGKLSGPLLDRIDLHLEVPRLPDEELLRPITQAAESSATVRARVVAARERQRVRLTGTEALSNADMTPAQVQRHCALDADGQRLMQQALTRLKFSARTFDRMLRVARTIADLEAAESVQAQHLAEALQFRALERLFPNRQQSGVLASR